MCPTTTTPPRLGIRFMPADTPGPYYAPQLRPFLLDAHRFSSVHGAVSCRLFPPAPRYFAHQAAGVTAPSSTLLCAASQVMRMRTHTGACRYKAQQAAPNTLLSGCCRTIKGVPWPARPPGCCRAMCVPGHQLLPPCSTARLSSITPWILQQEPIHVRCTSPCAGAFLCYQLYPVEGPPAGEASTVAGMMHR